MSMMEFSFDARPHPGPLPRGEGEAVHIARKFVRPRCRRRLLNISKRTRTYTEDTHCTKQWRMILPLLGERAGVRVVVPQTS